MTVYYTSYATLFSPETLSYEGEASQQYRIDLMKPSAPIESVNPSDILATVFRTNPSDPLTLAPKKVTANLAPFAGQTVRLRLAEVDNQLYFNAGADSVAIAKLAPPLIPLPPSNQFSFGKFQLNKKKGTGQLQVNVPGPGTLTAAPPIAKTLKAGASAYAGTLKAVPRKIKPVTVTVAAAGVATLSVKPTRAGRKILEKRGKLGNFSLNVTFTPTGGTAATQKLSGALKLKRKPNTSSGARRVFR